MVVPPRFKIGQMVWAKVGSNPWWPGQVYSEALASPEVKETKINGYLLVSFFGDDTYAWFDARDLLPFKPNFIKKAKEVLCHQEPHLKFETAIKHSLEEWRRRGEIGLACSCEENCKFITCNGDPNFYDVQIAEGANEFCYFGKFSKEIMKEERENIRPEDEILSFIQDLAVRPHREVMPREDEVDWIKKSREDDQHLDFIHRKGVVIGYRREWFGPESNSYELLVEAFQELRDEEVDLSPPHEDPNSAKSKRIVKPLVNKKTYPNEPEERKRLIKQSGKLPTSRFIENEHRKIHGASNKKDSKAGKSNKTKKPLVDKRMDEPRERKHFIKQNGTTPRCQRKNRATKKNGAIVSTELATERPRLNESNLKRRKKEQTKTSADTNRNVGKTGRDESKPSCKKYISLNSVMASEKKKVKRAPTPKEYVDYRSLNSIKASEEGYKAKRALSSKESEDYISLNSIMVPEEEEEAKRALTPKEYLDISIASSSQPLNPFVQLLNELRALATAPRAVVDKNKITNVSNVFEQFRSLTYQKSSANELARKAALYSSNLMKPASMNESNLKRQHTDQVDEITAKKLKGPIIKADGKANVSENNKVAETKTKIIKKSPPLNGKGTISGLKRQQPDRLDEYTGYKKVQRSNKTKDTEATISEPQNVAVKSEPRPITLTNLILQFPPNSKLPTVMELKMKFIRFGPIVTDKIYVSWYSYTCTILFKYKSDAEVAQRSKEHHKFGRTEALYAYISECGEPENLQAQKQQPEENSRQAQVQTQQKPQLKSCLKKPIESSASNGSAACVRYASEKVNAEKEFSDRMLTLLRQCSEIVNTVKATFGGYIPYHLF